MEISDDKFERAREQAEGTYKSIGKIYCPYLGESVAFNAKGIEHIKFKALRHARLRADQYVRLVLIPLAPKILSASHTVQGIARAKGFERERTNSRWETILRSVTYYEFIAVINEARVRIIVKRVETGPPYFWSIIPFWKMQEGTAARIIHSGKPESD